MILYRLVRAVIPKSIQTAAAEILLIASLVLLQQAIDDAKNSNKSAVIWKISVGLLIGLPASVAFIYFRSVDKRKQHYSEAEILSVYVEAERQRKERAQIDKHTPAASQEANSELPK